MATAIPAAIGVGTSIIGGIQGKGAAKQQRQLAEQQMRQLQPLINAQTEGIQFGLGQARSLFPQATDAINMVFNQATGTFEPLMKDYKAMLNDALGKQAALETEGTGLMNAGRGMLAGSLPYLQGGAAALKRLGDFYGRFMDGSSERLIEQFLPSGKQIQSIYGSDIQNVNDASMSASSNIEKFAGRGGGRVSSMNKNEMERQKGINQIFSQGKQNLLQTNLGNAFQGAAGQQNVANSLVQLGLGKGQLGLGTIGAGQQSKQLGNQALGTGGNLALGQLSQALQSLGLAGNAAGNLGSLANSLMGLTNAGGNMYSLYNQQANRAYGSDANSGRPSPLGGYLVDLFKNPTVSGSINNWLGIGKPKTSMSWEDFQKD